MKKLTLLGSAAIVVFALSACTAPSAPAGGDGSAAPSAVGTWGVPDTEGEPYLELSKDGVLAGSDGCNRLVGNWEIDDAGIDFGDIASTRMACEGVDTWLSLADSAVISGTTMTIVDDKDSIIGTLELQ